MIKRRTSAAAAAAASRPAGKWDATARPPATPKYVICNGDEGDPGAYMDRSVLEGNPHPVLEGMIIGAYAIGAGTGLHLRPQRVPAGRRAPRHGHRAGPRARAARARTSWARASTSTSRSTAAAAPSSAASPRRSWPPSRAGRASPAPSTSTPWSKGLWDKPTVLNNVETWANVPLIIDRGADWYRRHRHRGQQGHEDLLPASGKINNTGLVEVPMGTTLRDDRLSTSAAGSRAASKFKAVQTGGPSGGCIPESMLDLPVDFDDLDQGRLDDGLGRHDRHGRARPAWWTWPATS
ncbi:MAG: hypothetical protein MZU91_06650 [Desulfosudis oleivorans]|nr:hypothetical protein [Desulfosudis oleivorans]